MTLNRSWVRRAAGRLLFVFAAIVVVTVPDASAKETSATAGPPFHPSPSKAAGKTWDVKNFGPVGVGITLKGTGSGFTMTISKVEKGSPVEATGKLKKGQLIESINGHVLGARDPRMVLGDIITAAKQ